MSGEINNVTPAIANQHSVGITSLLIDSSFQFPPNVKWTLSQVHASFESRSDFLGTARRTSNTTCKPVSKTHAHDLLGSDDFAALREFPPFLMLAASGQLLYLYFGNLIFASISLICPAEPVVRVHSCFQQNSAHAKSLRELVAFSRLSRPARLIEVRFEDMISQVERTRRSTFL
jgi:hypothetical protein